MTDLEARYAAIRSRTHDKPTPGPSIAVVGSLNMDLVTRVSRIPAPGETLTAKSFQTGPGGKGANQAVACARLSASFGEGPPVVQSVTVRMFGAVGDDQFGEQLVEHLNNHGITNNVETLSGQKTGVGNIIVEEDTGENRIMLSTNANGAVPAELGLSNYRYVDAVVFQLEIPLETVTYNIDLAAELNSEVILNPAPALRLDPDVYAKVSHLIMNETEAAILSNRPVEQIDATSITSLSAVSSEFIRFGVKYVIITLGGKGVFYHTRDKHERSQAGVLLPARKTTVVDTTAAGDTFVGAYAVGIAKLRREKDNAPFDGKPDEPYDIHAIVEFAIRASSKAVEREGAQESIPWRDEVPTD